MLKISNLSKSFAGHQVLDQIDLQIAEGEFFSLLGPSGCGKTTLLRIISGLELATSGQMSFEGERLDLLSPQKRPFNMVFQRYALFPHLNVYENVAFGLRIQKKAETEIKDRVSQTLNLVNLSNLANRFPETLSGGQAQRVALARALVNQPKILLLDEPLSALDQKMREHMQYELRQLQKKLGLIFIYVTHDQEEAFIMSDRIAILNQGHIEQVGTPDEFIQKPHTEFVQKFIGEVKQVPALVIKQEAQNLTLRFEKDLDIRMDLASDLSVKAGDQVQAQLRTDRLHLRRIEK